MKNLKKLSNKELAKKRFTPNEFSWELINKTLLKQGYSSNKILKILSALNREYKFENECSKCGSHKNYCNCLK